MTEIRSLAEADIPVVAKLFQKIFRKSDKEPSAELIAYLQRLYIRFAGETVPASKVLLDKNGNVSGFLGVNYFDYFCEATNKTLRTAIVSTLMVEDHQHNPLGGVKLMRSLQKDGYDLMITETASEVAAAIWKKLDAVQLTNYSLDWLRIIRPLSFMTEIAGSKLKPLAMLQPFARKFDDRKRNAMHGKSLRWSATPSDWPTAQQLTCTDIDATEFAELYQHYAQSFSCRPQWNTEQLLNRLEDAVQKPEYGKAYMVKAGTKSGKNLGLFLYHFESGKTARVLEFFSDPKAASQMIDTLIHHAASNGAVAIRGRTKPDLMEAMLGKRIAFTHLCSTMVWAQDPALLPPFVEGKALVNGLAGEFWNRLYANPL